MANNVSSVSFQNPAYDYAGELSEIERRKALAQALQAQGLSPGSGTKMAGNIAIKNSPLEGLAKALQVGVGEYGNQVAKTQQAELAKKVQAHTADTLSKVLAAYKGTPGSPEIQAPADELGGGPGRAAIPATPGDPMNAAALAMQDPQTASIAGPMMQEAMQSQQLAKALAAAGYGPGTGSPAPAAAPTGTPSPDGSTAVPSAAPSAPTPTPTPTPAATQGAVPPGVSPLAFALGQTGKYGPLAATVQSGFQDYNKPVVGRENAPILERGPDGQLKPSFFIPKMEPGIMPNFGPGGAVSASPMPGYAGAKTGLVGAEERARLGAQADFSGAIQGGKEDAKAKYNLIDVPVQIPDGKGGFTRGIMKMSQAEALQRLGGGAQPPGVPASQPAPPAGVAPPPAQSLTTLKGSAPTDAAALAQVRAASAAGRPANISGPQPTLPPSNAPATLPSPVPGIATQYGFSPSSSDVAANTQTAEANAKRNFNMTGLGSSIDEARSILRGASPPTSSGIGTVADTVGAFFGREGKGAGEADQLRSIGATLVSKMPRMEGPQSDRDVQNYKEAAGNVGDSTLPISRRLKSLEVVEKLFRQYDQSSRGAANAGGASGSWGSGWSIKQAP